MEYSRLLYEVKDRVARITLNAPEKMNALDPKMSAELTAVLQEIKKDDDVKVVVLSGSGKSFCAGGDVSGFGKYDLEGATELTRGGRQLLSAFVDLPKPIIAAVNGYAVGAGLSLVLISDMVIASEKAKFGSAFVHMGLIPDIGGLFFLPRMVGLQRAKELVFTGKNIDAQEAYRIGIVNTVVEHEKLDDAASELSGQLARLPGLAMGSAKRMLNASMDVNLDGLLELEALTQGALMQSEDFKEAVSAFMEKRKPVFK